MANVLHQSYFAITTSVPARDSLESRFNLRCLAPDFSEPLKTSHRGVFLAFTFSLQASAQIERARTLSLEEGISSILYPGSRKTSEPMVDHCVSFFYAFWNGCLTMFPWPLSLYLLFWDQKQHRLTGPLLGSGAERENTNRKKR